MPEQWMPPGAVLVEDDEWMPEGATPVAEEQPASPLARFGSAFKETLNPLNAIKAIPSLIPGTDANAEATVAKLKHRAENPFASAVADSPLGQFGGASAGERIAKGDVAGGLGEGAGLVTANTVAPFLPGASKAAGRNIRIASKAATALAEKHPVATSLLGAGIGYAVDGPAGVAEGLMGGGLIGKGRRLFGGAAEKPVAPAMPSGTRELDPGTMGSPGIRMAPPTATRETERVPVVGSPVEPPAKAQKAFATDVEESLAGELDAVGAQSKARLKEVDAAIAAEQRSAEAARTASARREAAIKAQEDAADLSQINKSTKAAEGIAEDVESSLNKSLSSLTSPAKEGLKDIDAAITAEKRRAGAIRAGARIAAKPAQAAPGTTSAPKAGSAPPAKTSTPGEAPKGPGPAVLDIPKTRSKNSLSIADDRLTATDMDKLKELVVANPEISIEEALEEMLQQRAQRSQVYREDARLSRLEQSVLDRDTR